MRGMHRHYAIVSLALVCVLNAPAAAQTEPDAGSRVRAEPGLDGQWAVQQWAPLRLFFQDPGHVESLEVFCADAGPRFNSRMIPAPAGRSSIDLAVYPQIASRRWIARLIRPSGQADDWPFELDVTFTGYSGPLDWPDPSASPQPSPVPHQMLLAAASEAAGGVSDLTAAAYLATGRPLRLRGVLDDEQIVNLDSIFGPPAVAPLVIADGVPLFWPQRMTSPPSDPTWTALAIIAGGVLIVLAIWLVLGRWPLASSLATIIMLLGVGWLIWPTQPGSVRASFELTVHSGVGVLDVDSDRASGMMPAAVRRQRWQCLASFRDGVFSLPLTTPTPRVLVAESTDRPDVLLPASFDLPADPARVRLVRGRRVVATSVEHFIDTGLMQMGLSEQGDAVAIRWQGWRVPLAEAWLVFDTRAVRLGDIAGREGRAIVPADREIAWDTVYTAAASDPLELQLRKLIVEHWSRRTIRGGRYWVVGFEPGPMRTDGGVLRVPALYAINVGQIEYD